MATEVRLPQWGMGMTDGAIVAWLKAEGDPVTAGEPLVEVEAAKANEVLDAPVSGVLLKILAQPDDVVPVRAVIALIAEPGEPGEDGGR
jgi:pyruvate/2-oxoglutarate dehydrogenase complex dihydrolipoamide acyltransferase (E2) component